ncbi:MAG TPA: FtsX-like permease family protein [Mucilaginibacter sp.]|nr:FtsX-like permease family protein [Mucilaginibacter sp.]
MSTYNFHINLYDIAFAGTIFIGLTFAVLLWLTKSINNVANRFLALALAVVVLWITRVLGIDIGLSAYLPHWSRLPTQFLLAFGPLIYFYALKLTRPEYKFRRKDLLHSGPLLLEFGVQVIEISESIKTGAATYKTPAFHLLDPVLHLLTVVSIIIYLYLSIKLIEKFYQRQKFIGGDRYRIGLRWLYRFLIIFCLLWLLLIPFTVIYCFYYPSEFGVQTYYPFYLLLTAMMIRMAARAHLKPEIARRVDVLPLKLLLPTELRQKGTWLKKMVKQNHYYLDPELSLVSLAEKLGLTTHELSRIINTALKKSFNEFINHYRVADTIRKMHDPAYDHLTLMSIAYDSGFNSKTTFNRAFKEATGQNPVDYKNAGKKEAPSYNSGLPDRLVAVISNHETMPKWSQGKFNRNFMFKNYLKNAWRHIMRHKTYSAINVLGLALGICGCLVIYLVASFEFSFDTFHPDKERIYCVDISSAGGIGPGLMHWNCVPGTMPDAMRSNMTGLETVAAFHIYTPKVAIKAGNDVVKTFDETSAIIAQPDYFDILPYKWLIGSKKTALANPMTVVLTQSRARTYFGNLPPDQMIGRTITYDDSLTVTVTGILQDWNKNSDFNFSDFISFSTINNSVLRHRVFLDKPGAIDGSSQVLVKLQASVSASQINTQFPAFVKKHVFPLLPKTQARLQPFTGIHFHKEYGGRGDKADLRVLYILSAVAIFILLIAAINFINLSTAQSIQRTRDIGILKVLGSGRGGILIQFLTETFILALLAVVIAVVAIRPLLGMFAEYVPAGVKFNFTDYTAWIFLIGIAIFTTLLAGFYPARVLSAFKAVASLKGETGVKTANKGYLRKSLIVFQFTISLIFITGTIMVNRQVSYMQNVDMGIKTTNIITLRSLINRAGKAKVIAEKIRQMPGIGQVITQVTPPMSSGHMIDNIQLQGSSAQQIQSYTYSGNEELVPFYHMKIVAGRNLLHTDSVTEYLVNVAATKALGFTDPQKAIGRLLNTTARDKAYPIVGVVADFCESSLYDQVLPCTISNDPGVQWGIALKLAPAANQQGKVPALVDNIAKEWKQIVPKDAFDYSFLGDSFSKMYENERRVKWLMQTATLITIFISCMGLFGLAMFNTQRRTKEISIRKVLGASVSDILTMLNKEVVVLIVISLLISSPIAWICIHKWLQNFAYHTNLSLWVFIMAGAGAMLIALITISFQTIRSAAANPVRGLRDE